MKVVRRSLKSILAAGILLCLMLCTLTPGKEKVSGDSKPTISQTPEKVVYYQSLGTKRMAERLARIYRDQDFRTDPSKDRERAEYYRGGLKQNLDLRTELKARLALAGSLLKAGESAVAVSEIESLRRIAEEKGIVPAPFFVKEMRQLLAIAYLRQGEQENCLLNHNRESCIYPIRLGGQHQLKRGSTGAIRELGALLNEDAYDASARWLLNIAHMTLGEHPQKVPPQWLIPTARFDSEYDIKRFNDVAPKLGLDVTGRAGGSVMEDFDGDQLLDLMITSSGPLDQLRFFRNNGDGSFSERTKEAGLVGETGGLNLIHGDYNNDGWPDVLVLRGGWWAEHGKYPPSLLRNNGDGTFDDVTEGAGLLSYRPTQTAAWADYDGDGWLDLYLGHEDNVRERHPSEMYHNNRDGTFTEVGAKLGLTEMGYVKGVAWGDFNNDGRPDLYVSRKGELNRLFRNDGPVNAQQPEAHAWKFTDVTARAGVGEPVHSFATWFWDYDNDSWQDLFVAGYYTETLSDIGAFLMGMPNRAEVPRLYRNQGDGTFADVTKQTKLDRVILPMSANYGDLDNDGWLDCYFGTSTPQFEALLPNKMFRNAEGRVFQDVTTSGGFGHLQKGHAVSFGDLDHDGDQDIFEVIGGALAGDAYQSVLFENPGHGQRWLALELTGVRENRSAIGVRVRVRVKTKDGARDIHRTISSGGSFGASPFRLHVGLGDAVAVDEIEIRWPVSGKTQLLRRGLLLDHHYRLREGESQPSVVELKSFSLAAKSKTETHRHH
ncbi:MAG: CRTAC1 family protein [Acidobacteriota bacterium]|nr:CRTAC1 family protein [Acidobacteriota bacterium]